MRKEYYTNRDRRIRIDELKRRLKTEKEVIEMQILQEQCERVLQAF